MTTLTQTRHLTAAEIRHYASLGMVTDSALAERLPDIAQAAYAEAAADGAETDLAKEYESGFERGTENERIAAASIIRRLLRQLDELAPESDRDWRYDRALNDACGYLAKLES